MKIIKKTLVVLILCSFIMGTIPVSVLAQLNSPENQIFENKGPDIPNGVEYVPGELIVKFEPGISNREIANINFKHGTSVKYTSPYAGFKILHSPKGKTVPEMVEKYNRNPNVEYAVVNSIAHAFMAPNDEYYSYQWHLDNDKYGGINMEAAWDISNGTGVIVAVLDTGVAYENYGTKYIIAPDLANTHFVAGYDFVNNDSHPNDDNSHGTHVTGTIAQSTNNEIGVAGVAYNCTIMPVKVLNKRGSGTLDQLVDGIYFATNNSADVISMHILTELRLSVPQVMMLPVKSVIRRHMRNALQLVLLHIEKKKPVIQIGVTIWISWHLAIGCFKIHLVHLLKLQMISVTGTSLELQWLHHMFQGLPLC